MRIKFGDWCHISWSKKTTNQVPNFYFNPVTDAICGVLINPPWPKDRHSFVGQNRDTQSKLNQKKRQVASIEKQGRSNFAGEIVNHETILCINFELPPLCQKSRFWVGLFSGQFFCSRQLHIKRRSSIWSKPWPSRRNVCVFRQVVDVL